MNDKKEVAVVSETAVESICPMAAAQILLDKNVDIDKIKDMIELQTLHDAIQAKKAYVLAMAEFKRNPPTILKDMRVEYDTSKGKTSYNHASLGNVTKEINASLSEHGFSSSWATEQPENNIKVTCTITHKLGHSESTSLQSPPDTSGGKNAIQAISSTVTYLERYTLLALTGLATHGQDDDGAEYGDETEYVNPKEKQVIVDMLADSGSSAEKFLKSMKCETIDKIPAGMYKAATTILAAAKKINGGANASNNQ